jgi:hypothetical protein
VQRPPHLHTTYFSINIFEEDGFCSPNIIVEPIRTRIHAYLTREERGLYVPNTFLYADGRFSTALSTDDTLEINIQALSLMRYVRPQTYLALADLFRYPGGVDDFDEYRRHLPEQWCPIVTVIGSVLLRNDNSLDPSELRHFTVETSIYDTSKAAPVPPSVGRRSRHHHQGLFSASPQRWPAAQPARATWPFGSLIWHTCRDLPLPWQHRLRPLPHLQNDQVVGTARRLRLPPRRDLESWNLLMRQQTRQKWIQLRQSQSEADVISTQSILQTHPPPALLHQPLLMLKNPNLPQSHL